MARVEFDGRAVEVPEVSVPAVFRDEVARFVRSPDLMDVLRFYREQTPVAEVSRQSPLGAVPSLSSDVALLQAVAMVCRHLPTRAVGVARIAHSSVQPQAKAAGFSFLRADVVTRANSRSMVLVQCRDVHANVIDAPESLMRWLLGVRATGRDFYSQMCHPDDICRTYAEALWSPGSSKLPVPLNPGLCGGNVSDYLRTIVVPHEAAMLEQLREASRPLGLCGVVITSLLPAAGGS